MKYRVIADTTKGSIPYSKVLRCVAEASAIAREEGYRSGWNDGIKNACAAIE
jgi:hypothetical protein